MEVKQISLGEQIFYDDLMQRIDYGQGIFFTDNLNLIDQNVYFKLGFQQDACVNLKNGMIEHFYSTKKIYLLDSNEIKLYLRGENF